MQKVKIVFDRIVEIIWYLLIILLPITSMPLVAKISGTDYVSPASGFFLVLMILLWLIPYIMRKGKFQLNVSPILFFAMSAAISTAAAFFIFIPPYKEATILRSSLKGLTTLVIGISFYLTASTYVKNKRILENTLRLINLSGLLIILWSLAQASFWMFDSRQDYPVIMMDIQRIFSTSKLFWGRVTGFALEPSWLAHQLNMLYLPYWLASTIINYSAHKSKLWKISVENMLLIGGVFTLVLTLSRGGWAAFLIMIAVVFIVINVRIFHWFRKRLSANPKLTRKLSKVILTFVTASVIIIYLAIVAGLGFFALNFDKRMQNLSTFEFRNENLVLRLANSLSFGERIIYWIAGWNIFNIFPIMGVGLGNAGYFIPSSIIPYGWQMTEIRQIVFHSDQMLNIKSIWFRLPAETGIVGVVLFLTWLYLIFRSAVFLIKGHEKEIIAIGFMGLFMLSAYIMEGISIDSFAMPYLWITAGLVTAVFGMHFKHNKKSSILNDKDK